MNDRSLNNVLREYGSAALSIFLFNRQLVLLADELSASEWSKEYSEENQRFEAQLHSIRVSSQALGEEVVALLRQSQTFGSFLQEAARLEFRVLQRFFLEHFKDLQTKEGCRVALLDIKAINSDLNALCDATDRVHTWLSRTEHAVGSEAFHDQLSFFLNRWHNRV